MAARFALHLDHAGVALHRHPQGPHDAPTDTAASAGKAPDAPLLQVALDDPQFDDAIARMREAIAEEVGGTAPVLVVLPDSQILYTDAPASGLDRTADEARVRTALEGATPYELAELAYDWREDGATLRIAVVARETVEEARGFVEGHGFEPVGFLGAAAEGDFPGRPRFSEVPEEGASLSASPAVAPDITGERDAPAEQDDTVANRPAEDAKRAAAEPDAAQPGDPDPAGAPAGHAADPSVSAAEPRAAFTSIRGSSDARPAALAEGAGRDREAENADGRSAPSTAPEAPQPDAAASSRAPRVTSLDADDSTGATAASLDPVAPSRPRAESGVRRSLFGRLAGAVRRGDDPEAGRDGARAKPRSPGKETPLRAPSAGSGAATAPRATGSPPTRRPTAALRAEATAPAPPATAPKVGAAPPSRAVRRIAGSEPLGTLPPPRGIVPSEAEEMDEADSLTVFGARRARSDGAGRRGSRALGLGLTLGLLALMALVALWSLWFGEQDGPETVAAAPETLPATESVTSGRAPVEGPAERGAAVIPDERAPAPLPTDRRAALQAAADTVPAADDDQDATSPAASSGSPAPPSPVALRTSERPGPAEPEAAHGNGRAEPRGGMAGAAVEPEAASSPAAPLEVAPSPLGRVAAEAAYARTGIWQRAPEGGTAPNRQQDPAIRLAAVTQQSLAPAAPAPPAPVPRAAAPEISAPALPPGSVRGPDGLVVATPEGALAPGGYTLFTGRPAILPPARPRSEEPAPLSEADGTAPADGASDDPLADARPEPRRDDEGALLDGSDPAEATQPDIRPRARPALRSADAVPDIPAPDALAQDARPPADDAAAGDAEPIAADLPDLRPQTRPATLSETAAQLLAEAERAERVAREEARAASEALALSEAELAAASSLAVPAAPAPRTRPSNMSQIAARARSQDRQAQERQAAARAASTPEPAAKPVRTAAPAPAPQSNRGPAVARSERIQPDVPSSTLVARQATQRNALRMSTVTLIGVYGSSGQRRALVRLPSGRYVKVQVGDRLDGGQVAAIGQDGLRYVKGGRNVVLEMPSG